MASVVDAARPANATKNCATVDYGDPFDVGFVINQSTADTHIDFVVTDGEEVGVDNTSDAAAPLINFSGFWLAKTAATERF